MDALRVTRVVKLNRRTSPIVTRVPTLLGMNGPRRTNVYRSVPIHVWVARVECHGHAVLRKVEQECVMSILRLASADVCERCGSNALVDARSSCSVHKRWSLARPYPLSVYIPRGFALVNSFGPLLACFVMCPYHALQGTEPHWFDAEAMELQINSMVENAVRIRT